MRWLRPSAFHTRSDLQRKLNAARARKIGGDWQTALVGVIEAVETVDSEGESILHPIDGQTRIAGASIHEAASQEEVVLPTVVYLDLTDREIAQLFIARNQLSSKVSAFDQYRLGIVAKEPWALAMKQVFGGRRSRFRIDASPSSYEVAAVGAVRRSMDRAHKLLDERPSSWNESKVVMRAALDVVEAAWPTEGADRVNGDILQSIVWLLTDEYDEYVAGDVAPLVKVLEQKGPKQWAVDAAKIKEDSFSSGARYKFIVKLWREALDE